MKLAYVSLAMLLAQNVVKLWVFKKEFEASSFSKDQGDLRNKFSEKFLQIVAIFWFSMEVIYIVGNCCQ